MCIYKCSDIRWVWLDSIAVPVFAVWFNLTNTESIRMNTSRGALSRSGLSMCIYKCSNIRWVWSESSNSLWRLSSTILYPQLQPPDSLNTEYIQTVHWILGSHQKKTILFGGNRRLLIGPNMGGWGCCSFPPIVKPVLSPQNEFGMPKSTLSNYKRNGI